jgi:hypothetical protein
VEPCCNQLKLCNSTTATLLHRVATLLQTCCSLAATLLPYFFNITEGLLQQQLPCHNQAENLLHLYCNHAAASFQAC